MNTKICAAVLFLLSWGAAPSLCAEKLEGETEDGGLPLEDPLTLQDLSPSGVREDLQSGDPFLYSLYLYFGLKMPTHSFGGDFNGSSYFTDGQQTIIIPDIDAARGFGLFLGARTRDIAKPVDFAFEACYAWSSHSSRWKNASYDALYQVLSGTLRSYLTVDPKLQPFVDIGFYLSWLTIKNGSTQDKTVGNADYQGYGYTFGGGAAYFLRKDILVSAGVEYDMGTYPIAETAAENDKKGALRIKNSEPFLRLEFLF